MLGPLPMTPRDLPRGYPIGQTGAGFAEVPRELRLPPREALERVIGTALRRPPCIVAFSGGRDSSAVLAIAMHVARRDGLPEPIAVTRVFPDVARTDEREWQELVLRHLGVSEWVREQIVDEMDVIGPLAQERLVRHGVLWPALLHGDDFLLRHAIGGSVLDGEGGDDVLGPESHRVAALARLLREPRRADRWRVRKAAGVLAPGRLRGRRARRRAVDAPLPWLRPAARAAFIDDYEHEVRRQPLDPRASIRRVLTRRSTEHVLANRRFFAREADVAFTSPFLEPVVADAVARRAGWLGYPDRAASLRLICGDLLPDAIVERRTKAEFNGAIFRRHSAAFAARWSGAGLDEDVVDTDVLRRLWSGGEHNALSSSLLQAAWLADRPRPSRDLGPEIGG